MSFPKIHKHWHILNLLCNKTNYDKYWTKTITSLLQFNFRIKEDITLIFALGTDRVWVISIHFQYTGFIMHSIFLCYSHYLLIFFQYCIDGIEMVSIWLGLGHSLTMTSFSTIRHSPRHFKTLTSSKSSTKPDFLYHNIYFIFNINRKEGTPLVYNPGFG